MRTNLASLKIKEIEMKTTQRYQILLWEIFFNDPKIPHIFQGIMK